MENEAASADAAPERTSKRLILKKVDVLVIALALFWIFAGALKLLDLGSFSEVVATHGVVPINSPAVLSIVPVAEVLFGIFMATSVGSLQGVPILKASLLAGCVLLFCPLRSMSCWCQARCSRKSGVDVSGKPRRGWRPGSQFLRGRCRCWYRGCCWRVTLLPSSNSIARHQATRI